MRSLSKEGVARWIQRQLDPGTIKDEKVEKRLVELQSLELTPAELYRNYPPRKLLARQLRNQGLSDEEIQQEIRTSMKNGSRRVSGEIAMSRVLRAVYSERQLQEALVDFWANHFNVFIGKDPAPLFLVAYEKDYEIVG